MIQCFCWVTYMSIWIKTKGDLSIELVNVLPRFVSLLQAPLFVAGHNLGSDHQHICPLDI